MFPDGILIGFQLQYEIYGLSRLAAGRPFDYCLKGDGGDEREMKKAQRTEFTALVTGRGVEPLLPP